MPEFRQVRYYRCEDCGATWATNLDGVAIPMGREAASVAAVG
jgi:hypothetical protein